MDRVKSVEQQCYQQGGKRQKWTGRFSYKLKHVPRQAYSLEKGGTWKSRDLLSSGLNLRNPPDETFLSSLFPIFARVFSLSYPPPPSPFVSNAHAIFVSVSFARLQFEESRATAPTMNRSSLLPARRVLRQD